MKQTFTKTEVYNNLTDETGIRIIMEIEKREPTPILDALQRKAGSAWMDKWEYENIIKPMLDENN